MAIATAEKIEKDDLITAIEGRINRLTETMAGDEKRIANAKAGLISDAGDVRQNIAANVATRTVILEELKVKIKALNSELEDAVKDLPRRSKLREKAEALELEAREVDRERIAADELSRSLQVKAEKIRDRKTDCLNEAGSTLKGLALQAEAAEKRNQDEKKEKVYWAKQNLLDAERNLKSAQDPNSRTPEMKIKRLTDARDYFKKQLEGLSR